MLWQLYHQYHKTYGEFQNISFFDINAEVMNEVITNESSEYRMGEENIERAIFAFLDAIQYDEETQEHNNWRSHHEYAPQIK